MPVTAYAKTSLAKVADQNTADRKTRGVGSLPACCGYQGRESIDRRQKDPRRMLRFGRSTRRGTSALSVGQEPFLTNLITFVPQTEQVPLMAGRPFLSTTFSVFVIGRFALHFTQ
jgi:hypothetical protein